MARRRTPPRIVNLSGRDDAEVRKLIRFGMRGLDIYSLDVEVIDARRHASGRAWGENGHGFVVIRIPPDHVYPFKGWKRHRSSPLNHDHRDWRESVVALAAHEGKHIDLSWKRYYRQSKQQIEMACEAHERWVLDRYRESLEQGMAA